MQENRRTAPVGDTPTHSLSPTPRSSQAVHETGGRPRRFQGYLRIRTLDSFRHRNFRLLWATLLSASASGWIINVVVGWLAFELTGSPLLTGLTIGLGMLPTVFVGPIAGVFIDAWDRQKVLAAALGSWAIFTAVFGFVVIVGPVAPWHVFVFAFLTGMANAVLLPAEQSLLANVVPKRLMVNSFALGALAQSLTRLVAPAFAGFSIVLIGAGETSMLAVVLLLIATRSTLAIEGHNENYHRIRPRTVLAELGEAVSYIKATRIVLALTVLHAAFLLMITPTNMGLMPVYAAEVFSGGPQVFGLLIAALGAGMTIGTIALASIGRIEHRGLVIAIAAGLTAAGMLVFSQTDSLATAFPALVFYASTMVIAWTVSSAAIQSIVPDKLRGRVVALASATHIAFPIGTFINGGLAQLYGAPTATVVSMAFLTATLVILPLVFHGIWSFRLDDAEEESPTPATATDSAKPAHA